MTEQQRPMVVRTHPRVPRNTSYLLPAGLHEGLLAELGITDVGSTEDVLLTHPTRQTTSRGAPVGELMPGDKIFAYCVECQTTTSHTIVTVDGDTVCDEH